LNREYTPDFGIRIQLFGRYNCDEIEICMILLPHTQRHTENAREKVGQVPNGNRSYIAVLNNAQ